MDNRKHQCYYSTKCSWSKAFITEISKTPFKSEFQFISVDPPLQQALPKWLKKVPTLMIQGNPEPLTDSEVMNWLYERKMMTQQGGKTQGGGQGQGQQQQEPELAGWNAAENVSFAKGVAYSFNDSDTNVEGNGGNTIPGAFEFLNGANGMGDKSAQGNNPGRTEASRTRSKKEEMFDKQMEEYQRSRSQGMPEARRPM